MSRQGNEPESQIVLKRPRQEDRLTQHPRSRSIARSIVSNVHMFNWMSSLIQQQDGCLQMVAQRAKLEESNKSSWYIPLPREQRCHLQTIKYRIYVHNSHIEAQPEQARAERDNHFIQEEEEVLAHMRLLSSEAKDWKSSVVTEAEEVLCRESAQAAHHATEAQEAMDQQYQARWRQAEAELQDLCTPNSAQVQSLAAKLQETQLEHHSSTLHKRDSSSSRHKPSGKPKSRSNKQQH